MDGAVARTVLRFDRFALDLGRGCLRDGRVEVPLRPKSFDLLRALTLNAGRTVSKDELMDAVWPGVYVTEGSLFQCVHDVRRALGDEDQRLLRTVARRGYLLDVEVRREVEIGEPVRLTPAAEEPLYTTATAAASVLAPSTIPPPLSRMRAAWLGAASVLVAAGMVMALERCGLVGRSPTAVATAPAASSHVAVAAADGYVLAVLPFANLSGDPALDRFSNGVLEELLTELGRDPLLRVAARLLSFAQQGLAAHARHFPRGPGATYVLEGAVRREADRVRITARLVEAETGRQVWAERYDVEEQASLTLQEAVAARIAAVLSGCQGLIRSAKGARLAPAAGSAGGPPCPPVQPGAVSTANP
jgi:TolB-like protein/DNA-binding winged helix-turn-helix (wHTH) protein